MSSTLTPATTSSGQQVLILKEGSTQTKGRDAQTNNIFAAKLIAQIVKTSLGPRGMDKMLVDGMGDVTITNDGATILKEIDVQHPAAKMLVEISKTTDNEVGRWHHISSDTCRCTFGKCGRFDQEGCPPDNHR